MEKEVSIPKLNTSNYQEWKEDICMVLTMKELWDDPLDGISPTGMDNERQSWSRMQRKALAVIHLYCEREQKL